MLPKGNSHLKHGKSEGFNSCDRTSNLIQIVDFSARVTLKFDGWPRKTIWYLFYIMSSFVHHSKAMGEFKLELQSGNAQFGSKSVIFLSRVTWKFDGWPWKNNRAPLLYYIELCASFQSHGWIQRWVTVRKRPIWVKIDDFVSRVTLKFETWPWKTIGHLS